MGRRNVKSQNLTTLQISAKFVVSDDTIMPQAEELTEKVPGEGTPASDITAQNVHFSDQNPGFVDTRGWGLKDSLRSSSVADDAKLENFFSRPIKIHEIEWPVGDSSSTIDTFNPWKLFFENSRVINRLTNYRLLKANLRVKFVLNGNSFYYGRAIASYRPLLLLDSFTRFFPGINQDFVEASQRPHVYLNPTESQGGELFLPFFTPLNMLDITKSEWDTMGEIGVGFLQNLKHANGATTPVSITIFAWAEDVDVSVLTQSDPSTVVPQSEEVGIVSKPASAVAKIARSLKQIPLISNFATATEIGANSIAYIATLFGYSKPPKTVIEPFQPMSRQSMAHTDGTENLLRLTLDTKNELSIDPTIAGLDTGDELVISSIAQRESYLVSFPWTVGTANESLLWNVIVDPAVIRQNESNPLEPELHFPACAFASMPFQYWRGSLKYRFQIVCSGHHKGRLKIVYDPIGTPSGVSEYNTAYTEIVDISENNDFVVEVGWGQTTPWRQHLGTSQFTGTSFKSTDPLTYSSATQLFGNGTLAVYVVNDLTVPNSTINNDISINVFVSASDDFELSAPVDFYLNNLALTKTPPLTEAILPQSQEVDHTPVTSKDLLRTFGPKPISDGLVNKIHMGEACVSFRSLLKRYMLHEAIVYDTTTVNDDPKIVSFIRTMFPFTPGYTQAQPTDSNVLVAVTPTDSYAYAKMTLLNYLTPAFGAWRGGIRYTLDTTFSPVKDNTSVGNANSVHLSDSTWSVSRVPGSLVAPSDCIIGDAAITPRQDQPELKYDALSAQTLSNGITGMSRWTSKVNPIQSFEIPYFSQYRFSPARAKTLWKQSDQYQSSYQLLYSGIPTAQPNIFYNYVSAGEDFTLMFYLSPPIMYEQFLPDFSA